MDAARRRPNTWVDFSPGRHQVNAVWLPPWWVTNAERWSLCLVTTLGRPSSSPACEWLLSRELRDAWQAGDGARWCRALLACEEHARAHDDRQLLRDTMSALGELLEPWAVA